MAFSSFSSAVLLQHDRTQSIFTTPVHNIYGNEPGHVTRFKMADNTCTIFSHSNLSAFVQKKQQKINERMETLQNLKENFSWKFCFHRNT